MGTSYTLTKDLQGSSNSGNERFATASPNQGTVNGPNTTALEYFHQYLVSLSYSIDFGGNPKNPTLETVSFGNPVPIDLESANASPVWVDSNAPFSIPSSINNSTQLLERWITYSTNGTFDSPMNLVVIYYRQFYLDVSESQTSGGSVNPSSGWYNASSMVAISAQASPGWRACKLERTTSQFFLFW